MPYQPSRINFSVLGDIGQSIGQGLYNRSLNNIFANGFPMKDGSPDYGTAANLLMQNGHPTEGLKILEYGQSVQRANQPRYAIAPNGAMYITSGPGAGSVVQNGGTSSAQGGIATSQPTNFSKPKGFGVSDTEKLTASAGAVNQLGDLITSFKPEYGGYSSGASLNIAKNGIPIGGGLHVPDPGIFTGPSDKAASDWWDNYNQWVEPVRKGLYGSVLTPGEREAFEKARIAPSTDPNLVPGNLQRQYDILATAIARKAQTLKASGYDPSAVDSALQLDQLPETVSKNSPSPLPGDRPVPGATQMNVGPGADPRGAYLPPQTAGTVTPPNINARELQLFKWAQEAIAAGADPKAVASRLQQMGVKQ